MSILSDNFKNLLRERDIKFTDHGPSESCEARIGISFGGKNIKSQSIVFFFDKEGNTINVKSFSICQVSQEKLMDMLVMVNDLNNKYRWVKFYVDNDNEVTVAGDIIVEPNTVGEECLEILMRYFNIIDEVYPSLMRLIWG